LLVRGDLVGLFVADPGVEPATALAGIDHAIPISPGRFSSTSREGRGPLLYGNIGSQEAQGVRLHPQGAALAVAEDLGEPGNNSVAPSRHLAVLVLDLGIRSEEFAECLRILRVVSLDEATEQVANGLCVRVRLARRDCRNTRC